MRTDLNRETFGILLLVACHQVTTRHVVSVGSLNESIAHPLREHLALSQPMTILRKGQKIWFLLNATVVLAVEGNRLIFATLIQDTPPT